MTMFDQTPGKVVLDSGPLFNVLGLNYVRKTQAPKLKRAQILERVFSDSELSRNRAFQDAYFQFFSRIHTYLTTSHVIGEIQGLQNGRLGLYGQDLRSFWLHSMDFLRAKNLDERLICLLDLHARPESSHGVCELGPTDVGLIELAKSEGCIVFTEDPKTLYRRARDLGVSCRIAKETVRRYR